MIKNPTFPWRSIMITANGIIATPRMTLIGGIALLLLFSASGSFLYGSSLRPSLTENVSIPTKLFLALQNSRIRCSNSLIAGWAELPAYGWSSSRCYTAYCNLNFDIAQDNTRFPCAGQINILDTWIFYQVGTCGVVECSHNFGVVSDTK